MAGRVRPSLHGMILALLVAVLLSMAAAPARQTRDLTNEIDREQARLLDLEIQNARLELRLQRLRDPEYLEKLAREQLGLVKPGETAWVVVPPATPTATAVEHRAPPRPWYRRLWESLWG